MRSLEKQKEEVLARVAKAKCIIVMCDFDGVLSPIVRNPADAVMPRRTRTLLSKCAKLFFVVVISGRALSNVRSKVGICGIWYAGNHGLEWRMHGHHHKIPISAAKRRALRDAKRAFTRLTKKHGRIIVEDKQTTFSVHYRGISDARVHTFMKDASELLRPYQQKKLLHSIDGKKVINVRPHVHYNKGTVALSMLKAMPRGTLPIAIGDDLTDEDVFRALKNGITIRVGNTKGSAARYYVTSRKGVDAFLAALLRVRR